VNVRHAMDPTDSQPKPTSLTIRQIRFHAQCADAVCVKHRAQELSEFELPVPITKTSRRRLSGMVSEPIDELSPNETIN
jgi:hypothetical protein